MSDQNDQDIVIFAGDTTTLKIPLYDQDGAIVPLTGPNGYWWLGKDATSTGGDILLMKSTTSDPPKATLEQDGTGLWTLIVPLSETDTEEFDAGFFHHEARIKDAGGTVSTVVYGNCEIKPTIIRET